LVIALGSVIVMHVYEENNLFIPHNSIQIPLRPHSRLASVQRHFWARSLHAAILLQVRCRSGRECVLAILEISLSLVIYHVDAISSHFSPNTLILTYRVRNPQR